MCTSRKIDCGAHVGDDCSALAERLHRRKQLHITRSTIHTHNASGHIDVRSTHTLEAQQGVSHEPPVLLAD